MIRIYYGLFSGVMDRTHHLYMATGWIRLITNRGRQLIVGQPLPDRSEEEMQSPVINNNEDFPSPPKSFLAGFYGWWSPAHLTIKYADCIGQPGIFDAIGAFLSSDLQSASVPAGPSIEDRLKDSNNFFWEPSPPPPSWV